MTRVRSYVGSYWRWLGYRLRLSRPGRIFFTVVPLVAIAAFVDARIHGAHEGGAPLVVLTMVLVGVIALDTIGRRAVAVLRRLI